MSIQENKDMFKCYIGDAGNNRNMDVADYMFWSGCIDRKPFAFEPRAIRLSSVKAAPVTAGFPPRQHSYG
jgi:hypothetical protein